MEEETKVTIQAKDEAIKSRDRRISRLKEDLAHEEKRRDKLGTTSGGSEVSGTSMRRGSHLW